MQILSEIFYTFLITSVIGCCLACIKMAYKSKCYEINFLCFSIKRDVKAELNDIENNENKEESQK